jgi:hypothetical protein
MVESTAVSIVDHATCLPPISTPKHLHRFLFVPMTPSPLSVDTPNGTSVRSAIIIDSNSALPSPTPTRTIAIGATTFRDMVRRPLVVYSTKLYILRVKRSRLSIGWEEQEVGKSLRWDTRTCRLRTFGCVSCHCIGIIVGDSVHFL